MRVPTPLPIADRPVRVGILGLGQIFKLNGAAYVGNDDAEVVALCDLDATKVEAALEQLPSARGLTDIDRFLDVDMDLVEILVPSPLHGRITTQVLAAGYHVNLQKPMACSLEEADRMIGAARASGAVLRVMEDYLFFEPLQKLKEIVGSGEIGDPVGFHMKMTGTGRGGWDVPVETWIWQLEQHKRGLGILVFDDGWHKFAVARWLFGPVRDVMAWIGETPVGGGFSMEAPTTVMWNHTGGLRGVLDITLGIDTYMRSDYYSSDERFEVTGSRGFVLVNQCTAYGLQAPALEVYRDGEVRAFHALDDDWGSSFRRQTAHYLRWLRTGEGELLLDDTTAREILEFLFAAIESSRANRPVTIPGAADRGHPQGQPRVSPPG